MMLILKRPAVNVAEDADEGHEGAAANAANDQNECNDPRSTGVTHSRRSFYQAGEREDGDFGSPIGWVREYNDSHRGEKTGPRSEVTFDRGRKPTTP